MSSTGTSAQLVAVFTCVVLSLVLTWLLVRGVRGLWRKVYPFFGPEGLRSVSFIIVAPLFFPFLLPGLQKMLLLGCALLLGVPTGFLQRSATALSSARAPAAHDSFAVNLLEAFASLSNDYAQALITYSWNDSHLLLKLVLFLLVWGLAGQALKVVISLPGEKPSTLKGADERSNFEAFVKKLRIWQPGIALGLILVFGLYLTLASIAGIGELNEKPPSNGPDISPSGLRQELQSIQLTEDWLASSHPKELLPGVSQPFQALLELEKTALSQSGALSQPAVTPLVSTEQVLQQVQHVKQGREELKALWEQMRLSVVAEERGALELAHKRFELESYPMPYRERVRYFMDILQWYQDRSSRRKRELTDCSRSVRMAGQHLDAWAEEVTRLRSIDPAVLRTFESSFREASQQCGMSSQASVPMPTKPDSSLSLFFLPMSWIRESKSVSPALIIGMIGLGLLGSVVSSFIRRQRVALREHQAWKFPEMTGVLLRGLSAAVVVFLTVQGGLSIFFSQEHPNPNPYVVLLLCLVAAVFSEDAWAIARRRFTSYVGDHSPNVHPPSQPPNQEQP